MGAKVAIPLEFLLSYMVKDIEMIEKKRVAPPRLMSDTALVEHCRPI